MKYYTEYERMIMPEYGRNIQQMVNHALTIEDKGERTRCVRTIINIMGNLFPHLRDVNDFRHKLWDHLAIMSNFQLDIDYPYEIPQKNILYTKPERVDYPHLDVKYRHYGRTLPLMIQKASLYKDGEEKDQLISLLANHMKKCFLTWNKEVVDDKKIFDDLRELSNGVLNFTENSVKLKESKDILANNNKSRNKQRNKQKK